MAVDEVDELVQEMSQHPASKSVPNSHETASLRDLSDTQRLLAENEEVCSKLVLKIEKLVPLVLKDFEAMVHENEVLRQKLQANKISLDDLPDFKPEKFSLPGVTEAIPTYTSELTLSSQNFQPRPGRRKSALGLSQAKKRKSSLGNEEELVEGVNGLLAVRPTTPQSRDMAEITEEELEKRQKREQQKKDMEKIKNWSARNKSMQRSKSQDQLSTVASSAALGELTLDQQVEQEGKVFGSPEALKDEVRRALHKEDFSLNKYYKTSGWVQAIARSYIFEIFTLILIGVNCLWMSIDADLNKATLLPNADPLFQVAENLFCFGFTFELGIRFFALKRKKKCLKDAWFIFDAMLVILMIVEVWGVYLVMLLNGESVSVFQNATILRILRVLRLLRFFKCDCTTKWMKYWLLRESSRIQNMENVLCNSENAQGKAIYSLPDDEFVCQISANDDANTPSTTMGTEYKVIALTLAGALVLTLIVFFVIFKYRGEMKVFMFTHFNWHPFDRIDDSDPSKLYDAFVSYNSNDHRWVSNTLWDRLENHDPPYTLCVHDRDFQVGKTIQENIFKSVDQSKRMIMVLSNNFLKSEWCLLEFRAAHRKVLEERTNYLIIILLDDVNMDELDEEMKLYMRTNTYLSVNNKWFWQRLYYAMPHITVRQIRARNLSNTPSNVTSHSVTQSVFTNGAYSVS